MFLHCKKLNFDNVLIYTWHLLHFCPSWERDPSHVALSEVSTFFLPVKRFFFCSFSLLLLRVKGRGCHTLLKPYETNCGLWIWAIQIKFDWLIDWCSTGTTRATLQQLPAFEWLQCIISSTSIRLTNLLNPIAHHIMCTQDANMWYMHIIWEHAIQSLSRWLRYRSKHVKLKDKNNVIFIEFVKRLIHGLEYIKTARTPFNWTPPEFIITVCFFFHNDNSTSLSELQ